MVLVFLDKSTTPYILQSSANNLHMLYLTLDGKSLTKQTNNIGPMTEPWGTTNMLLKASFSAFALSHGDTSLGPSGLSSVGIAALVFNQDFCILVSKSLLAILVVRRSLFFAPHVFFSVNTTFSINIRFPQPCFFIL